MRRVLKTVVAGIGVTLALALLMLYRGIDLGFAQKQITAFVSESLGRNVYLGAGGPTLQLRKQLTIQVNNLSIDNAQGGSSEHLLVLGRARLQIDTGSLFKRPIVVSRLELDDARVAVETYADGQTNIPDLSDRDTDVDVNIENAKDSETRGPAVPIVFRTMRINNISMTHDNRERDTRAELTVETLTQNALENAVALRGEGRFQGYRWDFSLDSSPLRSLILGEQIDARFTGHLAALELKGELQLPSVDRLSDVTFSSQLSGSLPKEITQLSPLLDPDAPIDATIDVTDTNPGVIVNAEVALTQLTLSLQGEVDDLGAGDGLNLHLSAKAPSLSRVSQALNLGEVETVPLTLDGRLILREQRIELRDLLLTAGDHEFAGVAVLPKFPSTADAILDLQGNGPDFSVFQRLLDRHETLPHPYVFDASLSKIDNALELLKSEVSIGETKLQIAGAVGHPPNFDGSEVSLRFSGPSLYGIGGLLDMDLPNTPYSLSGDLTVGQDGLMTLNNWTLASSLLSAEAHGSLQTSPKLQNVSFSLTASASDIAELSTMLGVPGIGKNPGALNLELIGDGQTLSAKDIVLSLGGSRFTAEAITFKDLDQQLKLADGAVVHGEIADLASLLDADLQSHQAERGFSFDLLPKLSADKLQINLRNIRGQHIDGEATLVVGRDMTLDERFSLDAKLALNNPRALIPQLGPYKPPTHALMARSRTVSDGADIVVRNTVTSGSDTLLDIEVGISRDSGSAIRIALTGAGPDSHVFGEVQGLGKEPLPYSIDAEFKLEEQSLEAKVASLQLAKTSLRGSGSWRQGDKRLKADVHLLSAEIGRWRELAASLNANDDTHSSVENPDTKKDWLIPATPIPSRWMDDYLIDIHLTSDSLGIEDPMFREQSAIDKTDITFRSGAGEASLSVRELRGSRGKLRAEGRLTKTETGLDANLNGTVANFPLGLTSTGKEYASLPQYNLELELSGAGGSPREIASSLDGFLYMHGGEGTLKDMSLSFATESFVAQLIGKLLPIMKTAQPDMSIECSVLAARAENGVVSLDPGFVLRSKRVDLSARGALDLTDETLALRFDNQARKGLGISAASFVNPYVQITGTLRHPTLGLDVASSAIAGGAAVATGGLTALARPLYGRFLKRSNPCEEATKRWNKNS